MTQIIRARISRFAKSVRFWPKIVSHRSCMRVCYREIIDLRQLFEITLKRRIEFFGLFPKHHVPAKFGTIRIR